MSSQATVPSFYEQGDKPKETQTKQEECVLIPQPGRCIFVKEKAAERVGSIIIPGNARVTPTIGHVVAVGDSEREYLLGKRMIIGHMSGVPIYISGKPGYSVCVYEELLCEVKSDEEVKFETPSSESLY